MTQFLDTLEQRETTKDCQVCEKREATVWCRTCRKLICKDFQRAHSIFTKHDVRAKEERIDKVRKEKTELLSKANQALEDFGKTIEKIKEKQNRLLT